MVVCVCVCAPVLIWHRATVFGTSSRRPMMAEKYCCYALNVYTTHICPCISLLCSALLNTSPLYLYFFTSIRMSYINIIYRACMHECVCALVNPSKCFQNMQNRPIRGIFTWIHYITCRTINEIKYNRMPLRVSECVSW